VPVENTITPPPTGEYPVLTETYYVVQIGAFTTKDRAENFAESSRKKVLNEIGISYSDTINLYVVQIVPFYRSRQEAEMVRDNLRQSSDFNDAWIVTINK
jgi:cell division septation protein DedD